MPRRRDGRVLKGVIVLALAGLVHVPYDPALLLGVFGLLLLAAFTITAFGVMVAIRIKQIQTSTGVMQMIVMPMFLLSGALYAVSGLPAWLGVLNRIDPLTYAVDPMRRLVFHHLDSTAQSLFSRPPQGQHAPSDTGLEIGAAPSVSPANAAAATQSLEPARIVAQGQLTRMSTTPQALPTRG